MPVKSILSSTDKQIIQAALQQELYASHLYRQVANYMQRAGYFGAQAFFSGEAADELEHYEKHVQFMNDMGDVAQLPALPAINQKPAGLQEAVQLGFDTELALGQKYEGWYRDATSELTRQHLLQFLEIQRKSIGEYGDWLARLERAGGDECGLLIIDKEMGEV